MTITPHQPTLPPEKAFTRAENSYLNDSPPDLFPENQDSNFGLKRKIFSDVMQAAITQIDTIYAERIVANSAQYLSEWEWQLDLPTDPPGITVGNRRARVIARLLQGAFTRQRLRYMIETFLVPALGGDAIQLLPGGVAIPVIGLPLYSGIADINDAYRIYEDPLNFKYEVWIRSEITPDAQFVRELMRMTPAGYTLTFRNDLPIILNMRRTVMSDAPVVYIRMGSTLSDISGFSAAVTPTGTSVLAIPGLLHVDVDDDDAARIFNGSSDWINVAWVANQEYATASAYSFMLRLNALPTAGNVMTILSRGATHPYINVDEFGTVILGKSGTGAIAHTRTPLQTGQTYSIVIQYDDYKPEIWINKVDETVVDSQAKFFDNFATQSSTTWNIGRAYSGGSFLNGVLDEFAIFNKKISHESIIKHHNVARSIYSRVL